LSSLQKNLSEELDSQRNLVKSLESQLEESNGWLYVL